MIPTDPPWIEVWVTTGALIALGLVVTASVVLTIYALATQWTEEN